MVKETAPFPSGGYEPNKKRRNSGRANGTTKERKKKSRRQTFEQWLFGALPFMVDSLCRKMYENEYQNAFASREAFCDEYADLVVDKRRVKSPSDRADVLDRVLTHAESSGRVDIVSQGRKRVGIQLSEQEWTRQRRQAKSRTSEHDEKWRARRLRKEKAA